MAYEPQSHLPVKDWTRYDADRVPFARHDPCQEPIASSRSSMRSRSSADHGVDADEDDVRRSQQFHRNPNTVALGPGSGTGFWHFGNLVPGRDVPRSQTRGPLNQIKDQGRKNQDLLHKV